MGIQEGPQGFSVGCESTATGLMLHTCKNIQSLLSSAASSQLLSSDLRDAAVQYLEAPVIPYPVIRDTWVHLTPGYGMPFHQVLAGSSFVLESPKPREKSKELKDRLSKLQELADQKAYGELVKDVTKHNHDEDREYFSSYKNSLGFGLHVLFIMFTGYMFGYAIVRSRYPNSPSMHAVGGVCGLIAGMFVETVLFITRDSMAERSQELKAKLKVKKEQAVVLQASSTEACGVPASYESVVEYADEVPVLHENESEIQAEKVPSGVRKRLGVVQPPGW